MNEKMSIYKRLRFLLLIFCVCLLLRFFFLSREVSAPLLQPVRALERSPRVYVYELPESLLSPSEIATFPLDLGGWSDTGLGVWDRLEYCVWQAFLKYKYRVMDPEEADFFFVPHVTAPIFHASALNKTRSSVHFINIMKHIVSRWPYANSSGAVDHITAYGHDTIENTMSPSDWLRVPLLLRTNMIFIASQGFHANLEMPRLRRDIITIQPSADADVELARRGLLPRKPWAERRYLATFRGTIKPHEPKYSDGLRADLLQLLRGDTDIFFAEGHSSSYVEELAEAKFCLFIKGWVVTSERLGTIISAGCIPVILSDDYALPFWETLDWTSFSIRIPMKVARQPGALKSILAAVPQETADRLEAEVLRVRHSLMYHIPAEPGDAFSRIIETLALRMTVKPRSGLLRWNA
jgi:xylogalacturonan beta-1,3-xylosyltransferase